MLSMQESARQTQEAIGLNVKKLREKRGWSVKSLSGLVWLTTEALRMIELGMRMPRTDTTMRLAGVLGVDLDDLDPDWRERYGPLAWAQQQLATRPSTSSSPTTERRKSTGQRHKQAKRTVRRKTGKLYFQPTPSNLPVRKAS